MKKWEASGKYWWWLGNLYLGDYESWGPFFESPETLRARIAICEAANRSFWKGDLLTCFQAN